MHGLVIKKINKNNFGDLAYLIERLAEFEKIDPPTAEAKGRLKRDGLSKKPKYHAYVAYVDGKPVGQALFFMTYSDFLAKPTLYLENLFVLEEYRKSGIGKKLFDFCVEQAKKRHCGRLELSVLGWNQEAMRFYKKMKLKRLDWQFFRLTEDKF